MRRAVEVTPEAQAKAARDAADAQAALIRVARSEHAVRLLPLHAEELRPGFNEARGAHFARYHSEAPPPRHHGSRPLMHPGWSDAARASECPPVEAGEAALAWARHETAIPLGVGDGEALAPVQRLHVRWRLVPGAPNSGPGPADLRFTVFALTDRWTSLLTRVVSLDTRESIDLRDALHAKLPDAVPIALALAVELPQWETARFTGALEVAATTAVRIR